MGAPLITALHTLQLPRGSTSAVAVGLHGALCPGGELDCVKRTSSPSLTHEFLGELVRYKQMLRQNLGLQFLLVETMLVMDTGVLETSLSLRKREFRGVFLLDCNQG